MINLHSIQKDKYSHLSVDILRQIANLQATGRYKLMVRNNKLFWSLLDEQAMLSRYGVKWRIVLDWARYGAYQEADLSQVIFE